MEFWERRARALGADAVVSHRVAEDEAAFGTLSEALDGSERVALDLGCGSGRHTAALAEAIGGRSIAVDPIARVAGAGRERLRTWVLGPLDPSRAR